jgi:predicted HTH domain antitoxin
MEMLELPPDVSSEEARLLLAVELFAARRLSLGKAAEYARLSVRGFMDVLAQREVPVVNYPPEELKEELDG